MYRIIQQTLPVSAATGVLFYLNAWLRLALIIGDVEYHVRQVHFQKVVAVTALNTLAAIFVVALGWIAAYRFRNRGSGRLLRRFLLILFALTLARSIALFVPGTVDASIAFTNLWLVLAAFAASVLLSVRAGADSNVERVASKASRPLAVLSTAMAMVMIARVILTFGADKPVVELPIHAQSPASTKRTAAPGLAPSPRIVWVIFDEFDAALGFDHRPAGMSLPHIDRFSSESATFTQASSTSGYTVTAIPALLTGIPFSRVVRKEASDLILATAEAETQYSFRETPSVISWANAADVPVSIIGWTHPYCRVFADRLAQCAWYENNHMSSAQTWAVSLRSLGFGDAILAQARQEALGATSDPCDFAGPADPAKVALKDYRESTAGLLKSQRADVRRLLRSGTGGLSILHLATPHPPGVAPPATPLHPASSGLSIMENYIIADAVFGEIRSILEERGEWDSAMVILTSDHGLRPFWSHWGCLTGAEQSMMQNRNELRVPLIVKFPGGGEPMRIERHVETTILAPLVREVLEKGAASGESIARFLEGDTLSARDFSSSERKSSE